MHESKTDHINAIYPCSAEPEACNSAVGKYLLKYTHTHTHTSVKMAIFYNRCQSVHQLQSLLHSPYQLSVSSNLPTKYDVFYIGEARVAFQLYGHIFTSTVLNPDPLPRLLVCPIHSQAT